MDTIKSRCFSPRSPRPISLHLCCAAAERNAEISLFSVSFSFLRFI